MVPAPARTSTIVIGGVLLGSGILAVVVPARAPLATLLVLILGVRTWRAAWKASWGTTLRGALVWAAVAIAMGMLAQVVALSEPLESGRPWTARVTYLMVLSILAGLISVLGARNPGGGAWAILMVLLVVVFLIPWLEGARPAAPGTRAGPASTRFAMDLVLRPPGAGRDHELSADTIRARRRRPGSRAGARVPGADAGRLDRRLPGRGVDGRGLAVGGEPVAGGVVREPTRRRPEPPGAALVRLPRPLGRRLGPADPGAVQPGRRARPLADSG